MISYRCSAPTCKNKLKYLYDIHIITCVIIKLKSYSSHYLLKCLIPFHLQDLTLLDLTLCSQIPNGCQHETVVVSDNPHDYQSPQKKGKELLMITLSQVDPKSVLQLLSHL